MGFAIFFLITWLTAGIFIVIRKKVSIVENTFVFLVILIITINITWITTEELKLITRTNSAMNFTAYILNRSIIMPLVVLIQLNMLRSFKTTLEKTLTIVFTVMVMLILSLLSNFFKITQFIKWNYGFDLIYFGILLFIAYFSYRLIRKASKNVVEYS
ncbi:hypothetical protein NDK43_32895 [Neobacillus pocheonensis]|jgi:hypothetical protein|uniref:Histidine kinase N-terminal 7TM region domain-containing protein n=1 Tax=Neobacillus pocheonensis TaxID=363869 RepID=A0ABT0WKZ3_9BACI|nr:hypothetical protein [Neobacillus pocheonensis]